MNYKCKNCLFNKEDGCSLGVENVEECVDFIELQNKKGEKNGK